jgi:hypothetical protein
LTTTGGFQAWGLILGTLTTAVGGYVAARLAKSVPYWNALVFGIVGIIVGILMAGDLPLWYTVLGFGLTLPAALLGAYICKRGADSGPPAMRPGSQ